MKTVVVKFTALDDGVPEAGVFELKRLHPVPSSDSVVVQRNTMERSNALRIRVAREVDIVNTESLDTSEPILLLTAVRL